MACPRSIVWLAAAVVLVASCGRAQPVGLAAVDRVDRCAPRGSQADARTANLALLDGVATYQGATVRETREQDTFRERCQPEPSPGWATVVDYAVAGDVDLMAAVEHYRAQLEARAWTVGCLQTPIDGHFARVIDAVKGSGRLQVGEAGSDRLGVTLMAGTRPDDGGNPAPPWMCSAGVPAPPEPTRPDGEPGRGNGSGPDGECTGRETVPPCGPGAEAGRFYPYTWRRPCDEVIVFDGRRWQSGMPPPVPQGAVHAWARFDGAEVRLRTSSASVGFVPEGGPRPAGQRQC